MADIHTMADTVQGWLHNSDPEIQREFKDTPFESLVRYHSTVGLSIRNYFNLWAVEWTPVIENGIDVSENHPDRISMLVLEEVWRRENQNGQ